MFDHLIICGENTQQLTFKALWAFAPEGIELVLNTRASVGTRPRRTLVDVHLAVEAGVAWHTLTRVRVWVDRIHAKDGPVLAGSLVAQIARSVWWAGTEEG